LQSWQGVSPLWFEGEWALRGIPPIAVVVGETLAMAIAMVIVMIMIPHRRMISLFCLYL